MKTINKKQVFILFLALPFFLCFTQPQQQPQTREFPFWWTVEFHITVSGEYKYMVKNKGFDGSYSFNASVYGSLSDDTEDYSFVQVMQELKKIDWKEIIISKSRKDEADLSHKIKPEFSIDYVLQDGQDLSFDFEITPVLAPHACDVFHSPIKKILLPACSGEKQTRIRYDYNQGITSGSNRVRVKEDDIYSANETTRDYVWTWEETNPASSWHSRHQAKLNLKLTRLEKKKNTGKEG
jgi:hypothetical protein